MPLSRTSRRLAVLTLACSALVAATSAPGASAATQRYAKPNGTGVWCNSLQPCDLKTAVEGAFFGDEIILAPGDYSLTATLSDPHPITIRGTAGQQRPSIHFSGAGQSGLRLTQGSTLRYVEVDQAAQLNTHALYLSNSSSADQVIARASGADATAYAQNATIRNSIIVADGTNGWALETSSTGAATTGTFRHVTAIATGSGGIGIHVQAAFAIAKATVNATNVIARGGPGGASLKAWTDNSGAQATINVDYSNYGAAGTQGSFAAISPGNGIQHLVPTFADAAQGDYHQAPGSVTVGAGVDDVFTGLLDVDGEPRAIGVPDIGADELQPAPAPSPGGTTPTGGTTSTGGSTATTQTSAFAGVSLVSTRLRFSRRFVTVTLRCPAATIGACSGRTKLTARRVRLGRAAFSIAPGGQAKVKVRVTRAGRRMLGRVRKLAAKDTNAAQDRAGHSKTSAARVTIRRVL